MKSQYLFDILLRNLSLHLVYNRSIALMLYSLPTSEISTIPCTEVGAIGSATKSWQDACELCILNGLIGKTCCKDSSRFCVSRLSIGGISVPACNLSIRLDRRWNMVAEHRARLRKVPSKRSSRGPL
jgi:hypothetical protein